MTGIEDNLPHEISEVICLKCLKRWIAVYPEETLLKELQCPQCEEQGYVIKTGQIIPDMPDEKMLNDVRFEKMVEMWGKKRAMEIYRDYIRDE